MGKSLEWRSYVNVYGDFELPGYLFRTNQELMKYVLDMGTLLSDDHKKLRAFREQVRKAFRERWNSLADALEFFDLIVPCHCHVNDYCEECGGSRFLLNLAITPDAMREMAVVIGADQKADIADKLQKGLRDAIHELSK